MRGKISGSFYKKRYPYSPIHLPISFPGIEETEIHTPVTNGFIKNNTGNSRLLVYLHDEKRERVDEPEMSAGLLERQERSVGDWA